MKINLNKKGFTLLELMIVVIIIGVLAALALPKLSQMIESSKRVEALNQVKVIRNFIELCEYDKSGYIGCILHPSGLPFNQFEQDQVWKNLGIPDPGKSPGSIFDYYIFGQDDAINPNAVGFDSWYYEIIAIMKNNIDNWIACDYVEDPGGMGWEHAFYGCAGGGAFQNLKVGDWEQVWN